MFFRINYFLFYVLYLRTPETKVMKWLRLIYDGHLGSRVYNKYYKRATEQAGEFCKKGSLIRPHMKKETK